MITMASYNTEPRNCTVSGKITERLQNKMQGIFIRSGDTLNFSEQIYRALETWTALFFLATRDSQMNNDYYTIEEGSE